MNNELLIKQLEAGMLPYDPEENKPMTKPIKDMSHDELNRMFQAAVFLGEPAEQLVKALLEEVKRLREWIGVKSLKCGSGHEGVGCGETFCSEEQVFRCLDCSVAFHKHCLNNHFNKKS